MFFSLDHLLLWIAAYKYLILFPISIFEGPIITVIAGFLVSQGQLNPYIVLAVVVLGDLVGDTIYYLLGRYGRTTFIRKHGKLVGVTEDRLERMDSHFEKHMGKTLLFGKFSHAVGTVVLVAAGAAKVDYGKFLFYNFIGTVPKSLILLLIGYYFGSAYAKINSYLDTATLIAIIAAILLTVGYILFSRFSKKRV
jgi:membrane protein DedA with SNARE-associated domain